MHIIKSEVQVGLQYMLNDISRNVPLLHIMFHNVPLVRVVIIVIHGEKESDLTDRAEQS